MINSLRILTITTFLCIMSAAASHAVVTLESVDVDGTNNLNNNEGPISVGPGNTGDLEVLICTTFSDGNNFFNGPPAGFETLDEGSAAGRDNVSSGYLQDSPSRPAPLKTCVHGWILRRYTAAVPSGIAV